MPRFPGLTHGVPGSQPPCPAHPQDRPFFFYQIGQFESADARASFEGKYRLRQCRALHTGRNSCVVPHGFPKYKGFVVPEQVELPYWLSVVMHMGFCTCGSLGNVKLGLSWG